MLRARDRERKLSIRASKLVAQQLFSDLPIVFSGPLRHVADGERAKNLIGCLPRAAETGLCWPAWWQTARPQRYTANLQLCSFVVYNLHNCTMSLLPNTFWDMRALKTLREEIWQNSGGGVDGRGGDLGSSLLWLKK